MPLEESFAFLKQDDLTLDALLMELPIPKPAYTPRCRRGCRLIFVRSIANAARAWSKNAPARAVAGEGEKRLAAPLHAAAAAQSYVPHDKFIGRKSKRGDWSALSRSKIGGGKTARARRQNRVRSFPGERTIEGATKNKITPRATDLGPTSSADRCAGNLLRRFSRAGRASSALSGRTYPPATRSNLPSVSCRISSRRSSKREWR